MFVVVDINDIDFLHDMGCGLYEVFNDGHCNKSTETIKSFVVSVILGRWLKQYAIDPTGYGNGSKTYGENVAVMIEYLNSAIKVYKFEDEPTNPDDFCHAKVLNSTLGTITYC